jgi:hypothetical protein
LTAGADGLLSSMGASSSVVGDRRLRKTISFAGLRELQ